MDISKCGYLDASMNYSDTEGRAKIATLRFEKIARFSQNQDKIMQKFDLKAAKAGAAVCMRNGKPVRIICTDRVSSKYPVVVLVPNGEYEDVEIYTSTGKYGVKDFVSDDDLMMRDDDYAEKLARGEYGKHIDEATEADREYWRRVYAGQVMPILVDVVVREGRHVVKSGIGIADAVAEDSLKYADALLEELEKK